jgi:hypothetical protein
MPLTVGLALNPNDYKEDLDGLPVREAFQKRVAKLSIHMCAVGAYPIWGAVPMSSVLDVVLSLYDHDLLDVRFVRLRKVERDQHFLEALVHENGRYSRKYKTRTPADCWHAASR